MGYRVNPSQFSSMFFIPTSVVDKWIKLSGAVQLKVLLTAIRNDANDINPKTIADKLSISEPDVIDAINYWVEAGVLENTSAPESTVKTEEIKVPTVKKTAIKREIIKPTREEVAKRGNESQEITFMLREAQLKMGRTLKQNEASTLVWLHDDEGMDVSIILMLLAFLVSEGKATVGSIERTALSWIKNGVETVTDAENEINTVYQKRSAWNLVQSALGMDRRKPSEKESKIVYKWVCEFGYGKEIIKFAYDICVDHTAKLSFDYMNKVLEAWHKKGAKTLDEIKTIEENATNKKTKSDKAQVTYDIDKYKDKLTALPE